MSIADLRGPLLRDVSRSFFLSIRLLPHSIRDPVALAYLLARATDTIADTAEVPVDERLAALPRLVAAISGEESAGPVEELRRSFAPLQQKAAEQSLLAAIPELLQWLGSLNEADRADVRAVLATITRGQSLDLQRFAGATTIVALKTAAELDEYTYLVAGCVGEFWTRICSRHVTNFSRRGVDEMMSLAVTYGQGLQLTNILRDVGDDLRSGRCYLPADELPVSPSELIDAPESIEPVVARWLKTANAGLKAGIEYSSAIVSARIRIATALPALIGVRTIQLLQNAGGGVVRQHIKVPRQEVRAVMFRTLISRASPRFLRNCSGAL